MCDILSKRAFEKLSLCGIAQKHLHFPNVLGTAMHYTKHCVTVIFDEIEKHVFDRPGEAEAILQKGLLRTD